MRQAAPHHIQRQAIAFDHHLPKIAALRHVLLVALRAADQAVTACDIFQHPYQGAPTFRAGRMRIANIAGNFRGQTHGAQSKTGVAQENTPPVGV